VAGGTVSGPRVDAAVARAKAGDEEAFRFLYLHYADNVRGYVRSRLRSAEDAEDVTQQVFMRVVSAITRYEQRDVSFVAWLLRIAHNACVDHVRRSRPQAVLDDEREPEEPRMGDLERRELAAALQTVFADLPDDQRRVLLMRQVAGMSPTEIATVIDRTPGAVHCLHHRARKEARNALEAAGFAPVAA
jgi:RNA polymerase sigma-70 factor (ECF subfamily)